MHVRTTYDRANETHSTTCTVDRASAIEIGAIVQVRVIELVSADLAKQFMAKHGQEIMARIPLESVLNQAVASAVKGIAVSIDENEKSRDKT